MESLRPTSVARAPELSDRAAPRWPALPGPSAGVSPTSWPPLLSFRRHVHTRAGSARITPLWLSCSPNRTLPSGLGQPEIGYKAVGLQGGQIRASKWANSEYRTQQYVVQSF